MDITKIHPELHSRAMTPPKPGRYRLRNGKEALIRAQGRLGRFFGAVGALGTGEYRLETWAVTGEHMTDPLLDIVEPVEVQ